MSELDKKTLASKPAQNDLVSLVMEAFEKKNQERVDMLVTNAIKQLKMSRFKPDQTICISLTYLARTNPRVFHQSSSVRELLKSLLRRDQGPSNIKGKSDTILPVLAANILLATCDGPEVRNIILSKLDQWLTSSSKVADLVMHVLMIICMKCQSDQQTIASLIEMRRHWMAYLTNLHLEDNAIPIDLCENVRKLLEKEHEPSQIILYLNFLDRFDHDFQGLSEALAKVVLDRPMTLAHMFVELEFGLDLCRSLVGLFSKLLNYFKSGKAKQTKTNKQSSMLLDDPKPKNESVQVKNEPGVVKMEDDQPISLVKKDKVEKEEPVRDQESADKFDIENEVVRPFVPQIYIKSANRGDDQVWTLDKNTLEAALTLLVIIENIEGLSCDWNKLASSFLVELNAKVGSKPQMSSFFSDWSLSRPYDISFELRRKLYLSTNEILVDLSLQEANLGHLVRLLCQFDSSVQSIDKIFTLLEAVKDVDLIRSEIVDGTYFYQLMEFYVELGSLGAKNFLNRLEQV